MDLNNKTETTHDPLKEFEISVIWKDRRRYFGLPLSFTKYSISKDRIFLEKGLLSTTTDEILLYRIRDIGMSISLWQRIFSVGTVVLKSSDETMPELLLRDIKKPKQVKELVHKLVEEMKVERRMRVGELLDGDDCDSIG